MSKHLQIRHLGCMILLVACGWPVAASGQNRLPPDLLTAANASGRKPEIDAFVHMHVANIKAGGADVQRSREALQQQVVNPTNVPSQSFLDVYSASLASEISAQGLDKSADVRVRLNAAIVVCNVASHANNSSLSNVSLTFVKDSAEPVALWGLKSARSIIPSMILAGQNTQNVSTAVIGAVKAFPDSEFVPEDAYRALMLDTTDRRIATIPNGMLKGYLIYPLSLFEYRVSQYQSAAPKRPDADVLGTVFFVNGKIWEVMSPAQQAQAVNLTMALANGANNGTPELVDLIRKCGNAISVVAKTVNDLPMQTAAKTLSSVANNVPQDSIKDQIKALDTLVKARFPATPSTALNMNRP